MQAVESNNVLNILLIEDSLPDIVLTEKAFQKSNFKTSLHIVRDGEEAMLFLKKEGKYKDVIRPDLVLLDINLPRKSGYEVLNDIKQDKDLKSILVIMLTSSTSEKDISKSYQLHANSYIVKPCSLTDYVNTIHQIENFWKKATSLAK
ncbi:MAG: response regulator [Flammeovirgaceae bacterium]